MVNGDSHKAAWTGAWRGDYPHQLSEVLGEATVQLIAAGHQAAIGTLARERSELRAASTAAQAGGRRS
jgi:hypothetical protein